MLWTLFNCCSSALLLPWGNCLKLGSLRSIFSWSWTGTFAVLIEPGFAGAAARNSSPGKWDAWTATDSAPDLRVRGYASYTLPCGTGWKFCGVEG
jgi:hypothetical protein